MMNYKTFIREDLANLEPGQDPLGKLKHIRKYDFGPLYYEGPLRADFNPDIDEYRNFISDLYTEYIQEYQQKTSNQDSWNRKILLHAFIGTKERSEERAFLYRASEDIEGLLTEAELLLRSKPDECVYPEILIYLAQLYRKNQESVGFFFKNAITEALNHIRLLHTLDKENDNINSGIYFGIMKAYKCIPHEQINGAEFEKFNDDFFKRYLDRYSLLDQQNPFLHPYTKVYQALCETMQEIPETNDFNYFKEVCLEIPRRSNFLSHANDSVFYAITCALLQLPLSLQQEMADDVRRLYALLTEKKEGLQANRNSGIPALFLSQFPIESDKQLFQNTIEKTGKYYQEEEFVLQARYALWYISDNPEEALNYILHNENTNLDYIIALLADLDFKDALPLLGEMDKEETRYWNKEFLQLAINKLETQSQRPKGADRIVWKLDRFTSYS